ncbi:PAS domain-containing sensor histidine kinase [Cognatishimia sp. SS12]|uniref:PAS domain-containing sensor histidine kinase n=1 Tax=Cognatishimia sp. SS12 TaxID=2979465 RepID=UPI00232F6767|nr:PAS domain-containing sensor histidine kinase [Cognatishimia sp. SS12]MDC0737324.1 PAS domain-containing sensor histidine kinase [Cognatishimia sp. SS12]
MTNARQLALSEPPAQLETSVLEGAGIGIFDLDLRSGRSVVNETWKTMIGLPGDAILSPQLVWRDRIHPDDLPAVEAADAALFAGETRRSKSVFRVRHEAGHWVWIQSDAGVTERAADGKPVRLQGVHIDVTDHREQQQAKDEFIAMVSHELRTPLTSVLGALKIANSGQMGDLPAPVTNLLQLAQRNSNRLLHLVNELLDFQTLENGQLTYETAPIDARAAVSDAMLSIQGYLQDGQKVAVELPEGDAPLSILADEVRLQQVLANLLSNAAKFSPGETTIELKLTHKDDSVMIAVRDHGTGVPQELEGRMFQRFTQSANSQKVTHKSTGLGLAICKQMTEGMGGEIGYFNNDDRGATFWVKFPAQRD